jgi:hypothetical protein
MILRAERQEHLPPLLRRGGGGGRTCKVHVMVTYRQLEIARVGLRQFIQAVHHLNKM